MEERKINYDVIPIKDKILIIISEVLHDRINELTIIIKFITFLESVYLGNLQSDLVNKPLYMLKIHMPHTQLEYDTIYYDFVTLLKILEKNEIPQIKTKLLSFSEAIPFAGCINHQIRIFEDFITIVKESNNEDYVIDFKEDNITNLASAIHFYIKNECKICRLNRHGLLNLHACEDKLLQNIRNYLLRYPYFQEFEPEELNRNIDVILTENETDFNRKVDCEEEILLSEYYLFKTKMGSNQQYFTDILEILKRKSQKILLRSDVKVYIFETILFNSPTFIKVYVLILPCLNDRWLPYNEVKIIYSNFPDRVSDIHYYNLPKLFSKFTFVSILNIELHPMDASKFFASLPPLYITEEEAKSNAESLSIHRRSSDGGEFKKNKKNISVKTKKNEFIKRKNSKKNIINNNK